MTESCPHCSNQLKRIPKRKSSCGTCEKEIYVRSKQDVFPNRSLFTKEEADAVDWINRLQLTRSDFESERTRLSQQFGTLAKPRDVIYGLLHTLLLRAAKSCDFHQVRMINMLIATFLYEEGKDSFYAKQESIRAALFQWKLLAEQRIYDLNHCKVQVITCGPDSCEVCRTFQEATFSVDEAIAKMPIPVRNCANWTEENKFGWCRCDYVLVRG